MDAIVICEKRREVCVNYTRHYCQLSPRPLSNSSFLTLTLHSLELPTRISFFDSGFIITLSLSHTHTHLTLFIAPSVNGVFTYNPCNKSKNLYSLFLFFISFSHTFSATKQGVHSYIIVSISIFFPFLSLSLSDFALLVILQSNVGSLSAPTSVSNKGVLVPTCNSLKLRRSSFSTSLRISHLTSSSSPSSRRRPGFLSPVRASAEVRVSLTLCLVTAKISMFLTF